MVEWCDFQKHNSDYFSNFTLILAEDQTKILNISVIFGVHWLAPTSILC